MDARLKDLQLADSFAASLEREESQLDNGTRARAERDAIAARLQAAREYLAGREKEKGAREEELAQAESKIKQQQERLMSAASAHQVGALQRDIEGFSRRRGELDEAILMLMDDIEGGQKQVQVLEAALAQARAQAAKVEANFASETARIQAALQVQRARRDEARAALDEASLQKYDAGAKRHAGVAIVWPVNGDCSGCGTALTPFNLKDAKTQPWPVCESCNRLLLLS
jgi:predicted  nucleic acid-binding Zn-ribbon protein